MGAPVQVLRIAHPERQTLRCNRQFAIPNPQAISSSPIWPPCPPATDKAARAKVEAHALTLVDRCTGLDKTDLLQVAAALRNLGCRVEFTRRWQAAVIQAAQAGRLLRDAAAVEAGEVGGLRRTPPTAAASTG